MIKALIFDFDGVIAESADIKTDAFGEVFAEYPQWQEQILDYHKANMGISRFVKFKYFYENFLEEEYTDEIGEKLSEDFSKIVINKIIDAPLVKGAKEFLEQNHDKIICFIASGTPEDEMLYIAEQKELAGYFKEICGSPRTKDEIVAYILKKYSLEKEEVVLIGDALSDYNAAKKTGLSFLARLTDEVVFPSDVIGMSDLSQLDDILSQYT